MDEPTPDPTPTGPKRVIGGRPELPKVIGRPAVEPKTFKPAPIPAAGEAAATFEEVGEDGQPLAPLEGPARVTGMTVVPGSPRPAESVDFEHACCKAVRQNPDDPDPLGSPGEPQQELKKTEPFLTWQGPLKPTARFGIVAAVGGVLCAVAAVLGASGLVVAALATSAATALVLLYIIVSGLVASSATKRIAILATRHIVDPKLERGKLFHATLDTSGSVIPGAVRVEITDQVAPGLRPVERPLLTGPGRVTYKVRPQGRGLLTFAGLDVAVTSRDGMWVSDQQWQLRTTVEVESSTAGVMWKALVTGYIPFDQSMPSAIVKLYRDIETEVVREMAAGDKMRDVNWKYFARMGKMIVRQRTTEGETTILLAIDCTQTMLMDQAGYRNLDMAVEIAHEMAEAGLRRNHECGILAFNEARILDHVRPTRAKIQIKRITKHLQNLANHHLPEEGEDPVEILIAGDPENLRLGMGQGFKQRNTASLTMIFFTDLQGTPDEVIQTVSKAAQSGTRVVIMLLPGPKLKPVAGGKKAIDYTLRSVAHTNKMRELLIANGCEFTEVNPTPDDFKLEAELPEGFEDQAEAQA
ncbi:MAG: hypothetical protein QOD77_520 [Thermoplasmata archaeon]|jgi:uncharacterized protein (DUF58 family)|nr:hypothetical protein [Thermoplasmata archaeon]